MENIKMNATAATNNNVEEEKNMKTIVIATPENTPVIVIDHNKYGNRTYRAFGAYTIADKNGKKKYIPAHLEARGIGNERIAKIAFNEFVRKEYGATVFFFSRDIKGVREGCYFKEVTAEKKTAAPTIASAPALVVAPAPVQKGVRVLVTGTDTEVLSDADFKKELAAIVTTASTKANVSQVEFVNNGSLGTAFIELGARMNAGYKSRGLKVWTSIVADGVHEGFFAHVDVGTPEPEVPAPQPQDPELSPEKPEEKSKPDGVLKSIATKVKAIEEKEEDDLKAEPSPEEKLEEVPGPTADETTEEDDDLEAEGALADLDAVRGEIKAYEKANPGCKVKVPGGCTIVRAYYDDKTNKLECKVVGSNGEYNMNVCGPTKKASETTATAPSTEGVSFFDACSVEREEEPDNGWNDEDIENMSEAEFAFHGAIADIIDGKTVSC